MDSTKSDSMWACQTVPTGLHQDGKEEEAIESRTASCSPPPSLLSEDSAFPISPRGWAFGSPLHGFFESGDIQRWCPARFQKLRTLQEAPRNQGRVDCMVDGFTVARVAVKSMPNEWVRECHESFVRTYPNETERPWMDIGCTAFLTSIEYPYVCPLLGVYRDEAMTRVVADLATEGDLFDWAARKGTGAVGLGHEALVLPIARQIVDAVRLLHDHSIVHWDISLENVLLSRGRAGLRIQLCDFGMASAERFIKGDGRGKPSYKAPEVSSGAICDGFACDAFSVGVVLHGLMLQQMPWASTELGRCKVFEFFRQHGFDALTRRRKSLGQGVPLCECMSPVGLQVLKGLLSVSPNDRFTLGECADFAGIDRRSVWQETWL